MQNYSVPLVARSEKTLTVQSLALCSNPRFASFVARRSHFLDVSILDCKWVHFMRSCPHNPRCVIYLTIFQRAAIFLKPGSLNIKDEDGCSTTTLMLGRSSFIKYRKVTCSHRRTVSHSHKPLQDFTRSLQVGPNNLCPCLGNNLQRSGEIG